MMMLWLEISDTHLVHQTITCFFYIAICTAPYRGKTTSYIATEYSRIYPMLLNLNKKWIYTREIKNFENKFDELCAEKPSQSVDSFFFEILVAISYVEQGYFVEFIEKISKKLQILEYQKIQLQDTLNAKNCKGQMLSPMKNLMHGTDLSTKFHKQYIPVLFVDKYILSLKHRLKI